MGHLFIFMFWKKKKKKYVLSPPFNFKSEGQLKLIHMGVSSEENKLNQTSGTIATF